MLKFHILIQTGVCEIIKCGDPTHRVLSLRNFMPLDAA